MRMTKLAYMNFKSSFKSYLSLIISLAFTILVFFNFQNIIYSDTFASLGGMNKDYINMLIEAVSFVLGCFMFFFIWYATNVFLTKRKKEIGIYIFMGLSNQKIGKLYMMETAFIGFVSLAAGIVFGVITSGLFQMIMLAISDIAIEIKFKFSIKPVMITAIVFMAIYLLFGGMIPFLFQTLAANKRFLYSSKRCLWMNQVIFRMKKNYRTYAMVCILILCSVTALATGFAMKYRYDNMVIFDNTYTFQLLSNQQDLDEKATQLIQETNEIAYKASIPVSTSENGDMVVSYSDVKRLAGETGLEFDLEEPAQDEIICLSHLTLLSLISEQDEVKVEVRGSQYRQTATIRIPYFGYLQRQWDLYLVNDSEYENLKSLGEELQVYNYKVCDNDAFEEKERYLVMRKLGFEEKVLKKSIASELATAYVIPFIVMTISAYFSVHALEKMMYANLFPIYVVSVLVVLAVFVLCYCFSVLVYQKNV